MSRPAGSLGEVSQAVLTAVRELATADQAPTVAEIAAAAQVGRADAVATVKNLRRAGRLRLVRLRKVAYRNKPVGEYAPTDDASAPPAQPAGAFDFGTLLSSWIG